MPADPRRGDVRNRFSISDCSSYDELIGESSAQGRHASDAGLIITVKSAYVLRGRSQNCDVASKIAAYTSFRIIHAFAERFHCTLGYRDVPSTDSASGYALVRLAGGRHLGFGCVDRKEVGRAERSYGRAAERVERCGIERMFSARRAERGALLSHRVHIDFGHMKTGAEGSMPCAPE